MAQLLASQPIIKAGGQEARKSAAGIPGLGDPDSKSGRLEFRVTCAAAIESGPGPGLFK
jgi:hypothetical protein